MGFDFNALHNLETNHQGDLIESILDLHLIYDAGNGEVVNRFKQKWEQMSQPTERHL